MVKIAIASTDGKIVNQHFGKAERFYLVEVDEESGTFGRIEERLTKPICQNGDHEDEALEQAVQALTDCDYVLVSQIGFRARNKLEMAGIDVYEIPGLIPEAIDKLIRYVKVKKLSALFIEN